METDSRYPFSFSIPLLVISLFTYERWILFLSDQIIWMDNLSEPRVCLALGKAPHRGLGDKEFMPGTQMQHPNTCCMNVTWKGEAADVLWLLLSNPIMKPHQRRIYPLHIVCMSNIQCSFYACAIEPYYSYYITSMILTVKQQHRLQTVITITVPERISCKVEATVHAWAHSLFFFLFAFSNWTKLVIENGAHRPWWWKCLDHMIIHFCLDPVNRCHSINSALSFCLRWHCWAEAVSAPLVPQCHYQSMAWHQCPLPLPISTSF